MRIHGLCTCVDYAEYLAATGFSWLTGLSSLTIVSSPDDKATRLVAQGLHNNHSRVPVSIYLTHSFYENGASFNKGRAMEEARRHMSWEDWILFFDVDVIPALGHWDAFKRMDDVLSRNKMYAAQRWQVPYMPAIGTILSTDGLEVVPDDRVGYGYFQLFHSSHPNVQRRPLLDTCWKHAGNYDSNFLLSWGNAVEDLSQILTLYHVGPKHENWYGVGQEEKFREMQATRNGLGIHPTERISE